MPRALKQRLIIVAASISIGMLVLEGAQRFFLGEAHPGGSFAVTFVSTLLLTLLFAGVGLLIDVAISDARRAPSSTPPDLQPDDLYRQNQALSSQAQEQTDALDRLNEELQRQMARYRQAEADARTSEERFRNMADNIQEGLTIVENGQLVYLNERACEIFGDCPDGDIRARLFAFAAPEEQARLGRLLAEAERQGEFPHELEYWIVRKDGGRRCIRERYSTHRQDDVARTFIVTSDITAAAQAYQTLESAVSDRTRELSIVLDISRRIASTLELEPLLNLILDQIQTIIPYSGAAIFTADDQRLELAAHQVPRLPALRTPLSLSLDRAGPYRQVISDRKVVILADCQGDTPLLRAVQESGTAPPGFTFEHARSWIGIPLVVRDRVTGMLSLTHSEHNYYTQQHARLAMTITNQVAVAIENARLYEQAQNLAVLEERNRIARELHDSVTQLLYGIGLYCAAAGRQLKHGALPSVEQNLIEIKENALQALQEMRLLILELNPPLLQKAGLAAALQASLDVIETRTGLQTSLSAEDVERLPRALETELYRIAMEALNNLVRYSRAKKVTVDLRSGDGWVWMDISDNGVGFDLSEARASGGMGLYNMEQRARQLQGRLEINSLPGQGTCIRVEAPVDGSRPEPKYG